MTSTTGTTMRAASDNTAFSGRMWFLKSDGSMQELTKAWQDYTGTTSTFEKGGRWQDALHPQDVVVAHATWQSLMAGKNAGQFEVRIRRCDGAYRWFLIRVTPRFDAPGEVLQWHVQATDVDDLKCAQSLLSGEKVLLEMIANGSSMSAFLTTMCAIVDQISPDSLVTIGLIDDQEKSLSHTVTPNLPKSFSEAIDSDEFGADAFPCAAAIDDGGTLSIVDIEADCQWPIYRALALKHGIRATFITPIRAPDGEALGTFNLHSKQPGHASSQQKAIIEQFTHLIGVAVKRKRTDAALLSLQERFSLATQASAEGIWDWDISKDEMFISSRAQCIYGLEPGPTIRRREEWRSMITLHPEDVEPQLRMINAYLQGTAQAYDGEWRIQSKAGEYRWVRICGLCVRDAEGKPTRLAGSVSDIDTHKRVEAAFEQSRRLEALGTLAGGIAHDFNNILGVIIGYGEMASEDVESGTRLARNVERIMRAGERGRTLADRILSFSRSGMTEYVKVQVEPVVREAIDLMCASLPADIVMEAQLSAGKAAMMGDQTQIHQVVVNLMTNAAHAMKSGGTLTIILDLKTLDYSHVATTGVVGAGKYVVLQVADTGTGMDPEVQGRIFEPFFTTKEVGLGTGIGLSLVHNIVTQFGGAIDVMSSVNRGSRFSIYIPYAGDVEDTNADSLSPLQKGNGERILIIDDHEALLLLHAEILSDLGYAVYSFTSSTMALQAIQANPGDFDVLITDGRMPIMSGAVLIQEARKVAPRIPVILISGYIGESLQQASINMEADVVLKKPLKARDLADAMAKVLHRPVLQPPLEIPAT